jgi:hypothetical protein
MELRASGDTNFFVTAGTNTNSSQLVLGDPDDIDVGKIRYRHNIDRMEFNVNASERMVIDSSGNVGIGTVSPVTLKSSTTLQVDGNAKLGDDNGRGLLSLGDIASTGANVGIWRGAGGAYAGTGNYLNLGGYDGITFTTGNADIASQTERMRIDSSGNVGIGTTSPSKRLHSVVSSSGSLETALALQNSNAVDGTETALDFSSNTSFVATARISSARDGAGLHSLRFSTYNLGLSEAMRIDSSGNVLVGTTDNSLYNNSGAGNGGVMLANTADGGRIDVAREGVNLILNRLASDGLIQEFKIDGTTIGSISSSPNFNIQRTSGAGFNFGTTNISPLNSGVLSDNTIDLGFSSYRWNDLYLGGNIYLGGTGSANALDDYEEGTFTVTNAGDSTGVIGVESGEYTKIGRMVYIRIVMRIDTNFTGRAIGGLPFTVNTSLDGGSSWTPANVLTENSTNAQIIPKFANGTTTILFDENDTNNDEHPPNTTNYFYRISGWYITNA